MVFNCGKYGILFTISGFVCIKFSHFTLEYSKIAPLTCPYQFYLVDIIPNPTEHAFIVFWPCLHKLSHLFSHLKTKNYVITKLFNKAIRKCVQYSDQVPSHAKSFKRYVGPKKFEICTKKGPQWVGLIFFRTANFNFPKEDHKNSFYTKNHQNSMNRLEDIS